MTKKFTQRKRTVRRVSDSREPSPSLPSPAASSPSSSPTIGWSRSGKDSVETLRSQVSTPKPPTPAKSNSVFRALSKPFNRQSSSSSSQTILAPAPTLPPSMYSSPPPTPSSFRNHERSISASILAPPSASRPPADLPPQPLPLPLSPTSAVPPASSSRSRSNSVLESSSALATTCRHTSDPRDEEAEPKIGNFPRRHLVSNLQHFARYSSAAYGQSFLRILGLAKSEVSCFFSLSASLASCSFGHGCRREVQVPSHGDSCVSLVLQPF